MLRCARPTDRPTDRPRREGTGRWGGGMVKGRQLTTMLTACFKERTSAAVEGEEERKRGERIVVCVRWDEAGCDAAFQSEELMMGECGFLMLRSAAGPGPGGWRLETGWLALRGDPSIRADRRRLGFACSCQACQVRVSGHGRQVRDGWPVSSTAG